MNVGLTLMLLFFIILAINIPLYWGTEKVNNFIHKKRDECKVKNTDAG
jgi:hypothetical protein